MRALRTQLLGLVMMLAAATSSGHEGHDKYAISCDGTAPEALLEVPDPAVRALAQIHCTRCGHVLVAADGYRWELSHLSIAFTALPWESTGQCIVDNAAYFIRLETEVVTRQAAIELAQSTLPENVKASRLPEGGHKLVAVSNVGETYEIHFLKYGDRWQGYGSPMPWLSQLGGYDKPIRFSIWALAR